MRALILAAGEGRRLGTATELIPKPMLEVAGRPILEHNVRMLVAAGIREIAINTHYRPERIVEHFGSGDDFGADIRYSHESWLRGTAGALAPLTDFFNTTFLICFGDNLSTCKLERLVDFHRSRGGAATIALFERDDIRSSGVAELGADERILRFIEKPDTGTTASRWVNAGIVVAEPRIFRHIPREGVADLGRDVFPAMLADAQSLYGYRMSEGLWWIDTPGDYERTRGSFSAIIGSGESNGIG